MGFSIANLSGKGVFWKAWICPLILDEEACVGGMIVSHKGETSEESTWSSSSITTLGSDFSKILPDLN